MNDPFPVFFRVGDVARRLSLPRKEIHKLIREGKLLAHRIGEGHYRVKEADFMDFLSRGGDVYSVGKNVSLMPPAPIVKKNADIPHPSDKVCIEQINLPLPPELDPKRAAIVTPTIPSEDIFTLAYLIEEWLNDVRGRVRPKTYLSYEQMARLHILPILGPWRISHLDIRTVERFLQFKYQSGLSARTVQYIRCLLRQAYNEAIRWGWLSRNVPALSRGPKAERPQITVPNQEEAQILLDSFSNLRYGPLYITTLGLGLRLGEVLGLRWSDVCLPEPHKKNGLGQITVRVQLQKVSGEWEIVPPKSRSSVRALSLPAFVADALLKRRNDQQAEKDEAAGKWKNDYGLVFTNRTGGPLDESRVRQRFQEHLQRQNFTHMRFHDLRHLSASLLLSQGIHPRVLMEILGHSQISLTLDTYAHVMPSAYPDVARAMDKVLNTR